MDKYSELKKKVIKIGVIAAVAIGVTGGIMVFTSSWLDSVSAERNTAKRNMNKVQNEVSSTQERLESSGSFSKLYVELLQSRNNTDFYTNRIDMQRLLLNLKKKYRLTTLNVQMSSDQVFENKELADAKVDALYSELQIKFGGISDKHIFTFIAALLRDAPGILRVKSFSMNRSESLEIRTLRLISLGREVETVTGTIIFDWYGFKEQEQNAEATVEEGQG